MPVSLENRAAIVTGAGRGAGEALALALAAQGAKVCVSDLNPDRASRVAHQIEIAGGAAFAMQADISNKFQVASLIETARDHYGRLDIFIQHAHISPATPILSMDEWEWRRTVEVNLTGMFFCIQLAARVMADEGGGVILMLTRPVPKAQIAELAATVATQSGISALGGALAAEWASQGVRLHVLDALPEPATIDRALALCSQQQ
jgi:NAD(P)-dependent dehydrogenase (short-subunit alcohol dehydrogenase family)